MNLVYPRLLGVVLVLFVSFFLSSPVVDADCITPLSQARYVSANASATGGGSDSDREDASDFTPFEAAVTASASGPEAGASGSGSQDSVIGGRSIAAAGSGYGSASSQSDHATASAGGHSVFEVVFSLDAPTNARFFGSLTAHQNNDWWPCAFAGVTLTGPGGTLLHGYIEGWSEEEFTFDELLALQAGEYTLEVNAHGNEQAGGDESNYARAEFSVTLEVCPFGDCDDDGFVTASDLASFSTCLAGPGASTPGSCDCADHDLDGDVDLADFAAFQLAFEG